MVRKISQSLLPRWQKLLLTLYELTGDSKKIIKYEDIVVAAFKKFPETFHLRGYKEYPDSGDLIHKPLYDMRPHGLLTGHQKMFSLTDKGLLFARKLKKLVSKGGKAYFKPSREITKEIERILSSEAFDFFNNKNREKILDTDFLSYLGVSVHTSRNEFLNRLQTIKYAIEIAKKFYPFKTYKILTDYHKFMTKKFKNLIKEMSEQK
jgi:hypothetical protein